MLEFVSQASGKLGVWNRIVASLYILLLSFFHLSSTARAIFLFFLTCPSAVVSCNVCGCVCVCDTVVGIMGVLRVMNLLLLSVYCRTLDRE